MKKIIKFDYKDIIYIFIINKKMDKVLLIDLSYFNFYRFFATKQWYSRASPEDNFEDNYDWSKNTLFWDKYNKIYLDTLNTFIKKLKPNKIILCKDCPRNSIWRLKLYPEYKGTRENNKHCCGNVFAKVYDVIIPELLKNSLYRTICVDELEADDIIYLCIKKLNSQSVKPSEITVISSDNDLLQLVGEFSNVKLMDAKMVEYGNKARSTRDETLFMKAILGDTSDNIPKAFNKVGEKTAMQLYQDKNKLANKFKEQPDGFKIFSRNMTLIDFHNIPQELEDNFEKKYNN